VPETHRPCLSPNSTWLVTSHLDSRHVERVMSRRDVTSQVEFGHSQTVVYTCLWHSVVVSFDIWHMINSFMHFLEQYLYWSHRGVQKVAVCMYVCIFRAARHGQTNERTQKWKAEEAITG